MLLLRRRILRRFSGRRVVLRAPGGSQRLGPDTVIVSVKAFHFLRQRLIGPGRQILLPRLDGGFGQHLLTVG